MVPDFNILDSVKQVIHSTNEIDVEELVETWLRHVAEKLKKSKSCCLKSWVRMTDFFGGKGGVVYLHLKI